MFCHLRLQAYCESQVCADGTKSQGHQFNVSDSFLAFFDRSFNKVPLTDSFYFIFLELHYVVYDGINAGVCLI